MKKFFKEFKDFIARGNVLDLAVGVIIGGAFSAIITALTNGILMPLINALLAKCGGGWESAYTFLIRAYEADGVTLDLAKSIYIDWGAFITAIINFLLIAFVLFLIVKIMMNARNAVTNSAKKWPNREELKTLKAEGVNIKDRKAVIAATAELRERNKPAPEPAKPTQEELLTDILVELKKQNATKEKSTKTK